MRSIAGAPTPAVPKSMTAAGRPSAPSRLLGIRSEWVQHGAPVQRGAVGAVSQAAAIGVVGGVPAKREVTVLDVAVDVHER